MMDWDDLRFFLAVARKGSIRGAASQLQLSHSTVSRRINAFEQKLDIQLFQRLATGYVLTVAGENMLGAVERMDNEACTLDRQLFSRESGLNGSLRVTLSPHLANYLFMPDLVAFAEAYPGIELDINISDAEYNLTKREADIAIRVSENPPDYLVGRKLARHASGYYASQEYLYKNSTNSYLSLIGGNDEIYNRNLKKEVEHPNTIIKHQIDEMISQYYAAKAGLGVIRIACFIGDKDPVLRRVQPGLSKHNLGIWILTHQDLRYTARVRAFMDFIAHAFQKNLQLVEGLCPQV